MLSILSLLFSDVLIFLLGEGNGNPLQCSCLENPRDGGAWWAIVYGVAQSRTRLKRLRSSSLPSSSENMSNPCSPCFFFVFFFKFYSLEDVSLSLSLFFLCISLVASGLPWITQVLCCFARDLCCFARDLRCFARDLSLWHTGCLVRRRGSVVCGAQAPEHVGFSSCSRWLYLW